MPFVTLHVIAFCGDCQWSERVESPTPTDQARVIRHARDHERAGHNVTIEREQVYANEWRRS